MAISKLEGKVNAESNPSIDPQTSAREKPRVLGLRPRRGKQWIRYNAMEHGNFSEARLEGDMNLSDVKCGLR